MNERQKKFLQALGEESHKWLNGDWEQMQPPLDPGIASGVATEAAAEVAAQARAARMKVMTDLINQGKMVGIGTPNPSGLLYPSMHIPKYPIFLDESANEPEPPKPAPFEGDILTRLYKTLQGDKQEPNLYFVVADGVCRMITADRVQAINYYKVIIDGMGDPFSNDVVTVSLCDRKSGMINTVTYDESNARVQGKPITYPLDA